MKTIRHQLTNDLVFFLKPTLQTPVFLIHLFNRFDCDTKEIFIAPNTSGTTSFYMFRMPEDLFPFHSWRIRIYEQTSQINLDPELADNLLCEEDVHVYGSESGTNVFSGNDLVTSRGKCVTIP